MSLKPGEKVPEVELIDHRGEPAPLRRYWEKQPAVLFFVRHLG